jgi:hypothetical protein
MDDGVIRSTRENPVFLSADELCERWGCSRVLLDHMRRNGDGPRFLQLRRRGRLLYRLEDVLAFEELRTLERSEAHPSMARAQRRGSRHGS